MKLGKILIAFMALLLPASAFADDPLEALASKVKNNHVSFSYSFNISSNSFTGSGHGQVEDGYYKIVSKGMSLYCDGKSRWTVDESAKEVVVEPVESNSSVFLTCPAALLADFDTYFSRVSNASGRFDGKTVKIVTMTPKAHLLSKVPIFGKTVTISKVQLYFHGNDLVGMLIRSGEGSEAAFKISGLTFSAKKGAAPFRFNTSSLPSGWVVTDLR